MIWLSCPEFRKVSKFFKWSRAFYHFYWKIFVVYKILTRKPLCGSLRAQLYQKYFDKSLIKANKATLFGTNYFKNPLHMSVKCCINARAYLHFVMEKNVSKFHCVAAIALSIYRGSWYSTCCWSKHFFRISRGTKEQECIVLALYVEWK